jgi:hypothetical protein
VVVISPDWLTLHDILGRVCGDYSACYYHVTGPACMAVAPMLMAYREHRAVKQISQSPPPPRPKHMNQLTYERITEEYALAKEAYQSQLRLLIDS